MNPIAVEFDGVIYPSRNEAARKLRIRRRRIVAEGRVIALPPERRGGKVYTARRIEAAAAKIADIAAAMQEERGGTEVELRKRRLGLIKAIGYFRRRYGEGVSEVIEL